MGAISVNIPSIKDIVADKKTYVEIEAKYLIKEYQDAIELAVAQFERLVKTGDRRLSVIANELLVKIGTLGHTEFTSGELGINLGETWYVISLIEPILQTRYLYVYENNLQITVHHIPFTMSDD